MTEAGIARRVSITERAVQRIVSDVVDTAMLRALAEAGGTTPRSTTRCHSVISRPSIGGSANLSSSLRRMQFRSGRVTTHRPCSARYATYDSRITHRVRKRPGP